MLTTTLSLLGAVILILDIFAIVSVLLGQSSAMRKIMWIAIVLILPVIGMLLYFLIGRNSFDVQV